MPEPGDNVATDYDIARADQDAFAKRKQAPLGEPADKAGRVWPMKSPLSRSPQRQGDPIVFDARRTPRPRHHDRSADQTAARINAPT